MKISLKTGVSAGVMLALAASLITITDYTVKHEQIRIQTTETAVMSNASMEEIGNEITARIEAEEISAVIAKLDTEHVITGLLHLPILQEHWDMIADCTTEVQQRPEAVAWSIIGRVL